MDAWRMIGLSDYTVDRVIFELAIAVVYFIGVYNFNVLGLKNVSMLN